MTPSNQDHKHEQKSFFETSLVDIIDPAHPLVQLSHKIDWKNFEETFGKFYCDDNGRRGTSTRLMVSLHYLKYTFDLGDEALLSTWLENPYWQYFSGYDTFQTRLPIDPSSMTKWRNRIKKEGAETLLAETIKTGLLVKAIKVSDLNNINVDTTVQEKNIRFPTDARLYDRCCEKLVKISKKLGIELRQKYNKVNKRSLLMQSRYAHARQMKRAKKETNKIRTRLGRLIRDIERKKDGIIDKGLDLLLSLAKKIYTQVKYGKDKIYSVHEPEVSCISKGKANKKYEFGNKVGIATTSNSCWIVGAASFPGSPYDGHTLAKTMENVKNNLGRESVRAFTDMGYRNHDYTGNTEVIVDKKRKGNTSNTLWKWMKRRAAIEPVIGHLKSDNRFNKNKLKGKVGDEINAIMSAAAFNLKKLLRHFAFFCSYLFKNHYFDKAVIGVFLFFIVKLTNIRFSV